MCAMCCSGHGSSPKTFRCQVSLKDLRRLDVPHCKCSCNRAKASWTLLKTQSDTQVAAPCLEVQRVLNILGSAWITTEDILFQLSLEDLRRLDVPHSFCVGIEMAEYAEIATLHGRRQNDVDLEFMGLRLHTSVQSHSAVEGGSLCS